MIPAAAPSRLARAADLVVWPLDMGAPPPGPYVAIVPGADAPLLDLPLPPALKGAARVAVAQRQVLDRLGTGWTVHPFRQGSDTWTRVVVTRQQDLVDWRAAIGPGARALLPDYLALPCAPGIWTLDLRAGILRARLGPEDGFSAEQALAVALLVEARATLRLPNGVLRLGDADAGIDALIADLPHVDAMTSNAQVFCRGELMLGMAQDIPGSHSGVERALRRWLLPVCLLLVGALGWAGAQALAIRQDTAVAQAVAAETLAAAQRDLLGPGPVIDLERQVLRDIAARQTARAPMAPLSGLDVLHRAAAVLPLLQAARLGADGVQVDLVLADFRALDALVADLDAVDVMAQVLRSATEAGGVSVSLVLSVAP